MLADVGTIFYRTLVLYLGVLVVIRIMGKREVGQLSPFDLVVAIMIAESAAISMEDTTKPLLVGFTPIFTLMGAEVLLAYISLKFKGARHIVTGMPSILIDKGVIMEKEMRKLRYNINDLLSQLRDKNVANIADVEYAILEPSGSLSVFLKSDRRPVTPKDLKIQPPYEALPVPLIFDGEVQERYLSLAGKTEEWLQGKLQEMGIKSHKDVLFASLDQNEGLYVSRKNAGKKSK